MNNSDIKMYMIEGGLPLSLVKAHIVDRESAHQMVVHVLTQLGFDPKTTQVFRSKYNGSLTGLVVPKPAPLKFVSANWTKADQKGMRRPKNRTEEHKVFFTDDCTWDPADIIIQEKLGVPDQINYTTATGSGMTSIGRPMQSAGFLWLDRDCGPYALWIPDVAAEIARKREYHKDDKKFTITNGVESWKLNMEGLRPILEEEWDLLVAQQKLDEARARQQQQKKVA